MLSEETKQRLKERLDQVHEWPSLYMFKFIFEPEEARLAEVQKLFSPESEVLRKYSTGGKYLSLTVREVMLNADEVVARYDRASAIEGLIGALRAMLENLRLALLISLAILLVVVLYKRFKRTVMARDLPAPIHAELLALEVMYHPPRLRVELLLPQEQEVFPAMLSASHDPLHSWPVHRMSQGVHMLELDLDGRADGTYFFELATTSQRTERLFKLRRT